MSPLRADAQRNLERVLEAAADAFAEQGPSASVDEIARRAGVGHATVFRRFPTKDALIAAVVELRLEELIALAEAALESEDPGAAAVGFVWQAAEVQVRDRGVHDCFLRCEHSALKARLEALVVQIVERAQEAGAIRSDVGAADVPVLVRAAIKAAPPGEWRRYVEIVLDGLRADYSASVSGSISAAR